MSAGEMRAKKQTSLFGAHTNAQAQTQLLLRPLQWFRRAHGKTVWVSVGLPSRPSSFTIPDKSTDKAQRACVEHSSVCWEQKKMKR